ncbi:hypothetical protein K474DRAFT_1590555, partial [Panus rudis PR-1116 ss-1]
KIGLPDVFDGDKEKARTFINSLCLYIINKPHEFPTEEAKISFALSYIKMKKASRWQDQAVKQIVAGLRPFANWEKF